ncbi:Synaptotagmin-10, partial [Dinochytrium kinnereticum]
ILDDWQLDDEGDRADKKEDGRLKKFTKGLGSSAVGVLSSSVEHLGGKGEPKQNQAGATSAEAVAKNRNAPVRSLGAEAPAPGNGDATDSTLTRSISANHSLQALIEERQREQLFGTVILTIEAARNLKPVDAGGTSDPYIKVVQLVHGKEKVLLKTKVMKKTLDPVWSNETVSIRVPPNSIRIIMKDKNMFAESKPMGEIDLDLATIVKPGTTTFDSWLPLGLGGMGEVRIAGTYRPDGAPGRTMTQSTSNLSLSRGASAGNLKVPPIHLNTEDDEDDRSDELAGRLSPAGSVASSRSSLVDVPSNGTPPPQQKRRMFSFGKKPA